MYRIYIFTYIKILILTNNKYNVRNKKKYYMIKLFNRHSNFRSYSYPFTKNNLILCIIILIFK